MLTCTLGISYDSSKSFELSSVADPHLGILLSSLKPGETSVLSPIPVCVPSSLVLTRLPFCGLQWHSPLDLLLVKGATVIADTVSLGGGVMSPRGHGATTRGGGGCQHLHLFFCMLIMVSGMIVIQRHTKCPSYLRNPFDYGILRLPNNWVFGVLPW